MKLRVIHPFFVLVAFLMMQWVNVLLCWLASVLCLLLVSDEVGFVFHFKQEEVM